MRLLIIIGLSFMFALFMFYMKVKDIADKIDYKFKIRSVDGDLNTIIAYFAQKDNRSNVTIAYTLTLINKSFISIMVRDIIVNAYYGNNIKQDGTIGDLIAFTPDGTPNNYIDITS